MTREEAIADIRDNIKPVVGGISLDMAIKALEQEPCEDCISRQDVNDLVEELARAIIDETCCISRGKRTIMQDILDLPSVTPKEKTGHWIKVTNGRGGHECDLCHDYAPSYQSGDEYLTKYCPECGARMIEPQESEDKEVENE